MTQADTRDHKEQDLPLGSMAESDQSGTEVQTLEVVVPPNVHLSKYLSTNPTNIHPTFSSQSGLKD